MKANPWLAGLFATTLLYSGCKKEDQDLNSYFWSKHDNKSLSLYVDGQLTGALPYMPGKPDCKSEPSRHKALYLILRTGKHQIVAKDAQGAIISSSTIKITGNSVSSSQSTAGSIELSASDHCLTIGIY